MAGHKPILSVRIEQGLMDRLEALVEKTGVNRADLVERCLRVALLDEEEFVRLLESPGKGPLYELLLHPRFLRLFVGGKSPWGIDPVQQVVKENVSKRRRVGKQSRRVADAES